MKKSKTSFKIFAKSLSFFLLLSSGAFAQQEAKRLSPMSGLIKSVPFKDGQSVKEGDLIIEFDCDVFNAQLEQAKSRVNKHDKLLKSAKKLRKLGSESAVKVSVYQSELNEAIGAKKLAAKHVNQCTIKAPFDGRLAGLSVKSSHNVQEGEPLFNLINNRKLEAEMIVPSKWMKWLKPDHNFTIVIDETDERFEATVLRYGGKVDPVSQSVKVYSGIEGDTSTLLSGMSGRAVFELEDTPVE
jgi:RND family efflux transporter MFP subunit